MKQTAFISGANHGLGLALASALLSDGWQVFAGQYAQEWSHLDELQAKHLESLHVVPLDISSTNSVRAAAREVATHTNSLDVLINNAALLGKDWETGIRESPDYDDMMRLYNVNTLGALRMVGAFLPLLDAGQQKRLCFISSESGSIERATWRTSWFGYCQSKVALNMGVRLLFNDLHPQGYTFRLYHPGHVRTWMRGEKDVSGKLEPEEAATFALKFFLGSLENEDELKMHDWEGKVWPW